MVLPAGQRLGSYELVALLGAGGMGEVYRARDTRLGRDVALKLLPEVFLEDPEHLARFRREAQILAALSHPHIAAIHGLEESDGTLALALELVDGEDLAERLKRGPIPLDEALRMAHQIAQALEAAHDKGIVHRDLKPGNVKVARDGSVKLLDFGLAKAYAVDGAESGGPDDVSRSPTITRPSVGMILGTAAYMSPEQARGKPVDQRTDLWSFGVLLYEMLTGRRMFEGETASDTLAAVLTRDPDWSALPASVPAPVRRLLRRCVERDVNDRLRDAGDARLEIQEAMGRPDTAPASVVRGPSRGLVPVAWAAAVIAVVVGALRIAETRRPAPSNPVRRFDLALADLDTDTGRAPVLSPDGRHIVYSALQSLWVRDLDRPEPRRLVGTGTPLFPFWSPDSRQVAYLSGSKLWRVPATGGEPAVVANTSFNAGANTPGGAWLADGRIVFAPASTGTDILVVSSAGGDFSLFQARGSRERDFHTPSVLPDGRGVLIVADQFEEGPDTIAVLTDGQRKDVLRLERENLESPVYSPSGHILYTRRSGTPGIWAVPFSLERLERTGDPFLVVPEAAWPSVSADGSLLVAPAALGRWDVAWVDRDGKVLASVAEPRGLRGYGSPAVSPDGRRFIIMRDDGGATSFGVYAGSVNGGALTRLTFRYAGVRHAAWHPHRDRVVFEYASDSASSDRNGIASCATDGSGGERTLVPGQQPDISPDGTRIVYAHAAEEGNLDLYTLALTPEGDPAPGARPEPFLAAPLTQNMPRISPDGRAVAYVNMEPGGPNIYLRPFPTGSGQWQASTGDGRRPAWSRDGKRLFWQSNEGLMEADVTTSPISVGTPRLIFRGDASGLRLYYGFAPSPDGNRFLVVRPIKDDRSRMPSLTFVENWFEAYRRNQPAE